MGRMVVVSQCAGPTPPAGGPRLGENGVHGSRIHARDTMPSDMIDFPVVNALVFAGLGILVFLAALGLAVKLLPFDLRNQIVRERNVAAAIVAAAVALGLAWIVGATMH